MLTALPANRKVNRDHSMAGKGKARVPSNRSVSHSNLSMVKATLPESQDQAGQTRPSENDGDTHYPVNDGQLRSDQHIRSQDAARIYGTQDLNGTPKLGVSGRMSKRGLPESESQTNWLWRKRLNIRPGNGACVVAGGNNAPPTECGKAAYRTKASRFSNCKRKRGAQSAKPKPTICNP